MGDAIPTPMILAEHRVPDGRRPLVIEQHSDTVRVHQAQGFRLCFSVTVAAMAGSEPPASCQRRIPAGRFYLRWVGSYAKSNAAGCNYCAPCAIREWAHLGVHEGPEL